MLFYKDKRNHGLRLTQLQEVCTLSSIVLLFSLIGHNMVFISFRISLEIHYTNTF